MRQKINIIIDKTEKFLQTDLRYLLRGGFWQSLGQIITMLISLITMRAFAYQTSKEIFGTYQYILSIISILAIFTLPGIQSALIRAVAKGKEGTLKICVKEKIKWSLIGTLGCLAVSIWYFIHQNLVLGKSFLIASFLFPIPMISNAAFGFWQGRKNFKAYSKYSVIISLLEALFFIPILFLTNDIVLIMLAYFLSRTLFRFLFLKKTLQKVKNNEEDKSAISFGKHLTLMQAIGLVTSQLDKIIIWQLLGPVQVAIYSFAQIPITKINAIINPTPLLLPKLSQKNIKEIKKDLFKKFSKSFLFFTPFTMAIIPTVPFFFKLIFPQYVSAIPYTQILCLSFLFLPFSLITSSFQAGNKTKELYVVNILGNLLKIILFILLIPKLKIWGIIISSLLGSSLNGLLMVYLFKKID